MKKSKAMYYVVANVEPSQTTGKKGLSSLFSIKGKEKAKVKSISFGSI
jgi:hypothetical protein